MAEDRNVTTGYIVHRDKIDQFDSRIRYVKKAVYLISDVLLNFIGGKGEGGRRVAQRRYLTTLFLPLYPR